ncbi:MAG: HNH endonuclease [Sphingobacteriaceae bacterium]|nr:MAG: HNH endonuclease [Sphingobacteriaceae bacterium]
MKSSDNYKSRNRKSKLSLPSDFLNIADAPPNNIYDQFIESVKAKVYNDSESLEVHHVVPISHNGLDEQSNVVKISQEDHIEAHRLISEVTGNDRDIKDYNFVKRIATNSDLPRTQRQKGNKNSLETRRLLGTDVFNPAHQKEMSERSVASLNRRFTTKG